MAKLNTTIDEELYEGLQQARKGKPRHFCVIAKGQDICALIVQKKKITEGAITKAKTEAKGNEVIQGVVAGSGTDLAFEVLEAEPKIKAIKLRDFIAEQTDLTSKPRWSVVAAFQEVPEEEVLAGTPTGTGETTPPSADGNFAARARESLVAREKTIKSGLEWAAKTKSPHESAIIQAYEKAREKFASAKTESDFDSAVQAHDDVIGLIRGAIQEAKGPAKAPVQRPEVEAGLFLNSLKSVARDIQQLTKNIFANPSEVQRCAGLAKSAESHAQAGDMAQAPMVLKELLQAMSTASQHAEDAKKEFQNHPDTKYINQTIRAVYAWTGHDEQQRKAGRAALAANNGREELASDLAKAVELRTAAKLACQAWDKEVARVAQAAEAFEKAYSPHKDVIEQAGALLRKKGLPKPVTEALVGFKDPYNKFGVKRQFESYQKATEDVSEVAKLAQKVVDTERTIREQKARFNKANQPIRILFDEADKFTQVLVAQKLDVGPVKKLCDDLSAAVAQVDKKITVFAYDDAIPLLSGIQSAATALLQHKTLYDQAKQAVLDRCQTTNPDLEFARGMPDANSTVIGDKQAMEQGSTRINDAFKKFNYLAAANELDAYENAIQKVKLALEKLNREKAEFQADWDTVNDDYNAVAKLGGRDKKAQELVVALDKAYKELLTPFQAYDYATAKTKIPALRQAIDPLLVERPKQEAEWNKALKKVDSIKKKLMTIPLVSDTLKQRHNDCNVIWMDAHKLAGEGNFLAAKARLPDFVKAFDAFSKEVAANNKIAEPKAKEARKEVETLAKSGDLEKKTVAEKKALLEALRGATEMSKDERKAQRLIYASLELDEDFLKEDKKKRKVIAKKLTDTKEKRDELRDFRSNWQKKSLEQKLAVVSKALKAQCESMGFGDDPPEIVTYADPGTKKLIDNGYFNPGDGKIYLNTDPKASLSLDLDSTLDLVFHENSHNYQFKLIKRLDPTSPDPLDPLDPEYNQAQLFQMNSGPHAYVKSAEDFTDYKKQPLEKHAHDSGPKTARAVLDNIKTKKRST